TRAFAGARIGERVHRGAPDASRRGGHLLPETAMRALVLALWVAACSTSGAPAAGGPAPGNVRRREPPIAPPRLRLPTTARPSRYTVKMTLAPDADRF